MPPPAQGRPAGPWPAFRAASMPERRGGSRCRALRERDCYEDSSAGPWWAGGPPWERRGSAGRKLAPPGRRHGSLVRGQRQTDTGAFGPGCMAPGGRPSWLQGPSGQSGRPPPRHVGSNRKQPGGERARRVQSRNPPARGGRRLAGHPRPVRPPGSRWDKRRRSGRWGARGGADGAGGRAPPRGSPGGGSGGDRLPPGRQTA